MFIFSLLGIIALLGWAYLAFAHADFWIPLMPEETLPSSSPMPSVDIVVPARNEAKILPKTLPSLLGQEYNGSWRVIMIDDHSTDGTKKIAEEIATSINKTDRLTVISAPTLGKGWNGKIAAMNVGANAGTSDMILFTDADILHTHVSLQRLVERAETEKLDLTSRLVKLNCTHLTEKFFVPAFVFFFSLLYPFRRMNNPNSSAAAAAGSVMLIRRAMLDKIGGLGAIAASLIDDCNLAKCVKMASGKIELTFSEDTESIRPYYEASDIWKMVARTAYDHLGRSPSLLAGAAFGMLVMFIMPFLNMLLAPTAPAFITGTLALGIMAYLYTPTVKIYKLTWPWALTLPFAAVVYLGATLDSARLHYQGKGGQWKGRVHG